VIIARVKVIEYDYSSLLGQQSADYVRTDEARSAGNNDSLTSETLGIAHHNSRSSQRDLLQGQSCA
jgi:hypothetical protein